VESTPWWDDDGRTLYARMNDQEASEWRYSCSLPASSTEPVAILQLAAQAPPRSPGEATAALLAEVPLMLMLLHRLVDDLLLAWSAEHFRQCSESVGGYRQPPHPPGAACECPPPGALSQARELLAQRRPRT